MSELNEQQGAQGESTYWERPGSRSRERKGRSNSPNSSSQNKPANLKFDAHSTRRQPSPPNIRKSISPTTQRTMSQMKFGYPEKVLCTQYPSTRCSTHFFFPARLENPYEGIIVVQW